MSTKPFRESQEHSISTTMKLTVENDGTAYDGKFATVMETQLGFDHFGGVSATLYTDSTAAVGGYALDRPRRGDDRQGRGRAGTDYGMDHLIRILEAVGVEHWEKLNGRQVVVLFAAGDSDWGARPVGIAGVSNGKVLVFEEHAAAFRGDS